MTVDQMLYGTKREDTVPNVKLPTLAPLFPLSVLLQAAR